jgi:hypothetical protein
MQAVGEPACRFTGVRHTGETLIESLDGNYVLPKKAFPESVLIHCLLNDELLDHSYDEGLKRLVQDFAPSAEAHGRVRAIHQK